MERTPAGPDAEAVSLPPRRRSQTFASLQYREFRYLWIGTTASSLGWWATTIASLWLMRLLTDSALLLGMVGFLSSISMVVLGPLSGAVADRTDRRRLLLVVRSLSLVPTTAVALLVAFGTIQEWQLLAGTLAIGMIQAIDLPARQSLIPSSVPRHHLMNAFALQAAVLSATQILGPMIAGVLLSVLPPSIPFFLSTASFMITLWCIWRLSPAPYAPPGPRMSTLSSLKEGVVFAIGHPVIRVLLPMAAFIGVIAQPYQFLLPVFANDIFGVGATGYGVMQTTAGVGALAGTLVLASFSQVRGQTRLLVLILGAFAAGLVALGFAPLFLVALGAMLIVGACQAGSQAMTNTITQTFTPEQLRGRMTSLYMVTWGMASVGSVLLGASTDLIGIRATIALAGLLTGLTGAVVWLVFPAFRRASG